MTTDETTVTQRRYDRQARLYDITEAPIEWLIFGRLRRRLWAKIGGKLILEVGVGTGKNIPHHPAVARVVAIDLSPRMARKAAARAQRLGRDVQVIVADVQHLPFRDRAFDDTAATFVFCSVPDPVAGLVEVRRVTNEQGKIHLLEHVRSSNGIVGWLMDRLNPVMVRLMGANINRNTVANVERASLSLNSVDTSGFGILKLIRGWRSTGNPPMPGTLLVVTTSLISIWR